MNSSWLKEWEIYQSLREFPTDENPIASARIAEIQRTVGVSTLDKSLVSALWRSIDLPGVSPAIQTGLNVAVSSVATAPQVSAGDVLHLSPEVTDEDVDSVFVLVTEVRDGAALLTAFSSLGVPAAGDELLTGFEEEGVRVLSLWNAYWVPLVLTRQGWPVQIDTKSLMVDLASYRESILAGLGIPDRLLQRVGPPLDHPDDPRWAYYVREGSKLIKVVELGLQLAR
jgi:hypothetical protein